MKQFQLDDSPIAYYVSGRKQDTWVLSLHAAFAEAVVFVSSFSIAECFVSKI